MLRQLQITNLGVIDASVVELDAGLTVLTGETGAGKTMVVTGLNLLLGGRADSSAVRTGASAAAVEGIFALPADSAALELAEQAGAEVDLEDVVESAELIVVRSVGRRSRAVVGGRTVPVAVLAELGAELVAVHGQSEQILLTSPARQRELLDAFAGAASLAAAYTGLFDELADARATLSEITTQARQRRQEADLLRLGIAEVSQVDPSPGEDVELRALSIRLEHATDLATACARAHAALVGVDDAPEAANLAVLLDHARREVDHVAGLDPALAGVGTRLTELAHLVTDIAADLAGYQAGIDADPALLASTHDRRAELTVLTRKYGDDIDAVLAWAQQAGARLAELDGDDDQVERLTERVTTLQAEVLAAGRRLGQARRAAAERLAAAVTAELGELSMPGARFAVEVTEREPARHGMDDIVFTLAANRGASPRPLGKGASGGELSRVMLAIEVATLAGPATTDAGWTTAPATLVFDEVDAGVGGRAAVQIGRLLARLARRAQVIVVTHLPQVAAYADQHLVVEKSTDGAGTISAVREVDGSERVAEIARMLAGLEESSTARDHAEELLQRAATERDEQRRPAATTAPG